MQYPAPAVYSGASGAPDGSRPDGSVCDRRFIKNARFSRLEADVLGMRESGRVFADGAFI